MRSLGFASLALAASISWGVAAAARTPVALPSKACCDKCTVARWIAPSVAPVAASMATRALLLEIGAAGVLTLALVALRRRRPPDAPPQVAPARVIEA